MKKYFFCLALSCFVYGLSAQENVVDIKQFNLNMYEAEWLYTYDMVAWWTMKRVQMEGKEVVEGLGQEWFCFEDEKGVWHAVYGVYEQGVFQLALHYEVDAEGEVKRSYSDLDQNVLNEYGAAFQTAYGALDASGEDISVSFNQFIIRREDGSFKLWFLPALQSDGTAVFGKEFIYVINATGKKIQQDLSYTEGELRGLNVSEDVGELWLDYSNLDQPTVGGIFFVIYYNNYFPSVYINNRKSMSTLVPNGEALSWIHIAKDEGK